MIPIDIQVSRSKVKVKPILYMLGKGALVFYKHLYFFFGGGGGGLANVFLVF